MARHDDWHLDDPPSEILIRLADALVGQHRHSEAVQVLQHGATLERRIGRVERVKDLTDRADAIGADMAPARK
jgi:hypothetical protein